MVQHYTKCDEWVNQLMHVISHLSAGNNSQPLLMEYFPSPYGDRIVWGRQSLYYSPTGGKYVHGSSCCFDRIIFKL